jgi:predicted RNA-binding protein
MIFNFINYDLLFIKVKMQNNNHIYDIIGKNREITGSKYIPKADIEVNYIYIIIGIERRV